MKTLKCPKDGLFMTFIGPWREWGSTAPLGKFGCARGHHLILTIPWNRLEGRMRMENDDNP